MSAKPWRPADEAGAAGTPAVFVEWLRATGRMTEATPALVRGWEHADPEIFLAHVAAFAGLDRMRGVRANLLRHCGTRAALLVRDTAGAYRIWSRDELRRGINLPPPVVAALDGIGWDDLRRLAANHLLKAGTRPDDQVVWTGDPAAQWPYGAWIVGATLVLDGPVRPPA